MVESQPSRFSTDQNPSAKVENPRVIGDW